MIHLRETRPADLPSLAELFEGRFGHTLSPEEWHWKYVRVPGEARSRVAVDEAGRVLAHAGTLGLPARLVPTGGVGPSPPEATIWQLVDWAGSTSGAGLRPPLVDLGRALLADLPRPGDAPWIFGFPSERHFRLGERVFGYRALPAIMPLAGRLAGIAAGGTDPDGDRIEVSDHCGDWGEEAWEACGVPSVRRSAAFLNWRYHARPGPYYRFYRVRPAGRADGVDGLAVFAFVGSLARGAELWLPPAAPGEPASGGPEERWGPGLQAVARDLAAAGLERWELWPPPAPCGLEPLLHELGLRDEGPAVFMGCRARAGERLGPSPADPGFHYSMGDYDLV